MSARTACERLPGRRAAYHRRTGADEGRHHLAVEHGSARPDARAQAGVARAGVVEVAHGLRTAAQLVEVDRGHEARPRALDPLDVGHRPGAVALGRRPLGAGSDGRPHAASNARAARTGRRRRPDRLNELERGVVPEAMPAAV